MTDRPHEGPDALLLDEMLSPDIARRLVKAGVDCRAVADEPALRALDDADVLGAAVRDDRILVTNNVPDFEMLRRRFAAEGQRVPGLIDTSDAAFPRSRAFVPRLAAALEDAARHHRVASHGGVLWLRPLALG